MAIYIPEKLHGQVVTMLLVTKSYPVQKVEMSLVLFDIYIAKKTSANQKYPFFFLFFFCKV